jgi:peptidoglycan/LPS O-acetylase OafA/YrhL
MLFTNDTGFDISRLWISIAFFTAGLPGFFDATKNVRWMNLLGDLSYLVYLTHPMTGLLGPTIYFEFANQGAATQAFLLPMISTFLIASVATGIFAHYLIEKPLAAALKAAFSRLGAVLKRPSPAI